MNGYHYKIIEAINASLEYNKYKQITINDVFFIDDSFVDFNNREALKNNLIPENTYDEYFSNLLEGGPSWVHFTLVKLEKSKYLVTVLRGNKVGNPNPSLNVAIGIDKLFKLV